MQARSGTRTPTTLPYLMIIAVISVINCHQSEASSPSLTLQLEDAEGHFALYAKDEFSQGERADIPVASKSRCPHHPQAQWVRFDPSGQAWCDKMDCWDCYRL